MLNPGALARMKRQRPGPAQVHCRSGADWGTIRRDLLRAERRRVAAQWFD